MPRTGFIDHIGFGVPDLAAAKRYYDELMPIAHAKTPGVDAEPEPDDPALRAQRREAKAARDEARRGSKARVQALTHSKEKANA